MIWSIFNETVLNDWYNNWLIDGNSQKYMIEIYTGLKFMKSIS